MSNKLINDDPDVKAIRDSIVSCDEYEKSLPGYKGWWHYGDKIVFGAATVLVIGAVVVFYILPKYSEHFSWLIGLIYSLKTFLASLL